MAGEEPMSEAGIETAEMEVDPPPSTTVVELLRRFLSVQQRRALSYARLKTGFDEYMGRGVDSAYQLLCSDVAAEFNDCSKQVLEIESIFRSDEVNRMDLANLLKDVQAQEKQKLHLTAKIQVLKKAGRPSERLVTHEHCKFRKQTVHECVHVHEITEAMGTEEAEAEAEYENALKEAIRGVQDAVTNINEHLEEVRYEIEAMSAD